MTPVPCQTCKGARLKPEILAVTIKDATDRQLNIHQFSELTIDAAAGFISSLTLTEQQRKIAVRFCARSSRGSAFSSRWGSIT
jgi:excinuclease ABC subunit A